MKLYCLSHWMLLHAGTYKAAGSDCGSCRIMTRAVGYMRTSAAMQLALLFWRLAHGALELGCSIDAVKREWR